ncbi:MAG: hypothetical protein AAGF31_06945 [Planctomycetota bacterium]
MDREELTALISDGPVRITMNDGRSFDIPGPEMATVSDIAAAVLYRADDGKLRHIHLPLVTMTSVEPLGTESSQKS